MDYPKQQNGIKIILAQNNGDGMTLINEMKVPFYSYGNIYDESDIDMIKNLISSYDNKIKYIIRDDFETIMDPLFKNYIIRNKIELCNYNLL